MLSLTTAQRDLLLLLLHAEAPIGANALGEQLHLSARQIHYGLRDIEGWLQRRKAAVRNMPGLGVQIVCAPEQRQQLQAELAAQSRFQLILSSEQRQQLLALTLLAADEPLVLNQIQQDLAVARATVLKDLDAVEPWIGSFGLAIARRQHRGCWVEGAEFAKRQALVTLAWGDVPFERTILRVDFQAGVVFALAQDAQLLPFVAGANQVLRGWDVLAARPVIEAAERALGGRYTDEAVLALQLALAIQMQRVHARHYVSWATSTLLWIEDQPIWAVAERIAADLWSDLPEAECRAETAALALSLLCGDRDQPWAQGRVAGEATNNLIEGLLNDVVLAYGTPDMARDHLLREGLEALVLPASARQRFGLWAPPKPATDTHNERYTSERELAAQLAKHVEASTNMGLPPDAIDELTLLLRAAVVRSRAEHERRVLVVCPSGMATTQLLLARLKSRFPRLGTFVVVPLRELSDTSVAGADLILTTIPLTPTWAAPIDIIHVHPMLRPEDVAAITQWMA